MKLSIITINYNNLNGLRKTIDSVVSQTWRDFEWIVVDGGSTDGSRELIEEYAAKECFAWWCSEKDRGVYNAMNKGIRHSRGEYLNFMNSGDSFHDEDVLDKVFSESREESVLYGDALFIYKDRQEIYCYKEDLSIHGLYNKNICHQAMFIRKEAILSGFDESYKLYADWKKWMELAYEGKSFKYLGFFVCKYDGYGISAISESSLMREEHNRILEEGVPLSISRTIKDINVFLQDYKYLPLVRRTYDLIQERRLFLRIVSFSIRVIEFLKKIGF